MPHEHYPIAEGNIALLWAKCICPVCDDEIEHLTDDYESDPQLGELHLDTYQCERCRIFVIYVSPKDAGEYYSVAPADRRYRIECY